MASAASHLERDLIQRAASDYGILPPNLSRSCGNAISRVQAQTEFLNRARNARWIRSHSRSLNLNFASGSASLRLSGFADSRPTSPIGRGFRRFSVGCLISHSFRPATPPSASRGGPGNASGRDGAAHRDRNRITHPTLLRALEDFLGAIPWQPKNRLGVLRHAKDAILLPERATFREKSPARLPLVPDP